MVLSPVLQALCHAKSAVHDDATHCLQHTEVHLADNGGGLVGWCNSIYLLDADRVTERADGERADALVEYKDRGWCSFESAISGWIKSPDKLLNVGRLGDAPEGGAL